MIATSCFVTTVNAYLKRRRSCDTDCWPLPLPAAAAVAAAAAGRRCLMHAWQVLV